MNRTKTNEQMHVVFHATNRGGNTAEILDDASKVGVKPFSVILDDAHAILRAEHDMIMEREVRRGHADVIAKPTFDVEYPTGPEGRQKLAGGVSHRKGMKTAASPGRGGTIPIRDAVRREYVSPLPGLMHCGTPIRWLTPPANFSRASGPEE
jgi:hypothetical protein